MNVIAAIVKRSRIASGATTMRRYVPTFAEPVSSLKTEATSAASSLSQLRSPR